MSLGSSRKHGCRISDEWAYQGFEHVSRITPEGKVEGE